MGKEIINTILFFFLYILKCNYLLGPRLNVAGIKPYSRPLKIFRIMLVRAIGGAEKCLACFQQLQLS